jgi:hypothetical protein
MSEYRYELDVLAKCPRFPDRIDTYHVMLVSTDVIIEVETILEFFEPYQTREGVFQEVIANEAARRFRCEVEITGWHQGVKVTAVAP